MQEVFVRVEYTATQVSELKGDVWLGVPAELVEDESLRKEASYIHDHLTDQLNGGDGLVVINNIRVMEYSEQEKENVA